MQAKFVVLAVVLCLFSAVAGADTITGVSPGTVPFASFEEFITISGTGLIGTKVVEDTISSVVAYDTGETVEVTSAFTREGVDFISAAIPPGVALSAGTHTFDVIATDADDSVRRIGPGVVNVGNGGDGSGPPQITVPESVVAEVDSSRGAFVTFEVTAQSFDGTELTPSCTPASGASFALGTTHVACSATDAYGTAHGSFDVLVTDTVAPVLVLPSDIDSAVSEVSYSVSASDALDGEVVPACSPASGSAFRAGTTTVLCVAHDAHFNYAFGSFDVTVTNGPPALTVPDDFRAEATGPTGAIVSYDVSATGGATITCTPASGTLFPFGFTNVDCTATNVNGSATGSFSVLVIDTAAPVMTLPSPVVDPTSAAGAVVNYTATALDAVDGPVAVTCDPPPGSLFPIGISVVNCHAEDTLGNPTSGVFILTVNDLDTTPPDVVVTDITAEATSAAGAVVTYAPIAVDNVDGVLPVTCTPPSGSAFPIGATSVQCTATDAHGNIGTGTFTVTVRDSTAPTISSVSVSQNKLWPPNHKMVLVTVSVTATDAVDPSPVNKILSVSSNQPINGTGDGDQAPDWNITGPLQVQLRAERASGSIRVYTITVQSKDSSGNASTKTVQVSVKP
jgi:hypothetical protein